MPKRTDIQSILVVGAGPIVIGQACEFDYSGTQAIKALREEGYRIILVNSNPATIMTDPDLVGAGGRDLCRADHAGHRRKDHRASEKALHPDEKMVILPTMGGQTALNTALALFNDGTLEKYGVEMIGANAEAIDKAEDRQKFRDAMDKIGLESARSALRTRWTRRSRCSNAPACPPSSAPASPWAAPAAASPITRTSLSHDRDAAGWMPARRPKC